MRFRYNFYDYDVFFYEVNSFSANVKKSDFWMCMYKKSSLDQHLWKIKPTKYSDRIEILGICSIHEEVSQKT